MRRGLAAAIALGVAVRFPFWAEALRTPLDGDEAIIGLMARHVGQGMTFWGTAYLSPLEAWLAAPFVALLGTTTTAVRVFYFVLGMALIPLAYGLGRALLPQAALPAALLMACPSPYFLLMSALPPEVYPTALVLCSLLLILTLRGGGRPSDRPVAWGALWGALAGVAVWTHPMTATVVTACSAYVAVRARRPWLWLGAATIPFLVASSPLWIQALRDPRSFAVVSVSSGAETQLGHLALMLPRLHRSLGGILGTHVPVIPDDRDHVVDTPWPAAALLVVAYAGALVYAGASSLCLRGLRRNPGSSLLLGSVALPVLAFPVPLRSNPDAIRYLTPVYLPALTLLAWVAVDRLGHRRALWLVGVMAALHLAGGVRLLDAWRTTDRAEVPFLLPDLTQVRHVLEAHGIRRAYASYAPAYRLTFESAERLIVSQPWNERFPDYPLPYLDEVRFSKNVAWILTPGIPSDLPTPERFEAALRMAGGSWQPTGAGATLVYHDFVAPFGSHVVPLASAGPAGDGDLGTRLVEPVHGPSTYWLPSPEPLEAVTLVAGFGDLHLLQSMDVEASADGAAFDIVAQRRRGREHRDLRWVNGHPQYVIDHDLIAVPLGGSTVTALRVTPVNSRQAWAIGEILLHPVEVGAARRGAGGSAGSWDEWLDPGLTWAERRAALAAAPRRDREDWYYRSLLSERHR